MATSATTKAKKRARSAAKVTSAVQQAAVIEYPPLHWLGLGRRMTARALLHPVYAGAAVFAAGQAAHSAAWPAWAVAPAGIGLLSAAGAGMVAGPHVHGRVKNYFAAMGAAAAAYLTSVAATSPYSTPSLVLGAASLASAVFTYPRMREAQAQFELDWYAKRAVAPDSAQVARTDLSAEPVLARPDTDAERWVKLMDLVGLKGMTFVRRDDHYAGYSITMMLPTSGKVTYDHAVAACRGIEMSLAPDRGGLPENSVTTEKGRDVNGRVLARLVVFHFNVRDVLAETIVMKPDHSPLSITKAFMVGRFIDGKEIHLRLREIAALVVGVRGRGKSNFLNVLVYQISRCVDAVLWVIDLKGGRFVKPWLQAWLTGARRADGRRVRRPALDYVATTRIEAHRMMVALRAIIDYRANSGYGGEKLEPAAPDPADPSKMPAVIAVVDEFAALVGPHSSPRNRKSGQGPTANDFASMFLNVAQLGRSECCDVVVATQRSTVSMSGGGNLKSQLEMRIGLGVTNKQDANSVFDNDPQAARLLAKLQDQRTRGSVIIRDGDDGRVQLGKVVRMATKPEERAALGGVPDLVYEGSLYHGDLRPDLDTGSAAAADAAIRALDLEEWGYPLDQVVGYDDRWGRDRAEHLYVANLAPAWDDSMEPDLCPRCNASVPEGAVECPACGCDLVDGGDDRDQPGPVRPAGGAGTAVLDRPRVRPAATRQAPAQRAPAGQPDGREQPARPAVAMIPRHVDPDELARAAELVITSRLGSHSMLARKIGISLERAKMLMGVLEQLGIVGPRIPERTRDVRVAREDLAGVLVALRAGRAPERAEPAAIAELENRLDETPDMAAVPAGAADAPAGRMTGRQAFVRAVHEAGPRGIMMADIQRVLIGWGVITESSKQQTYRWRVPLLESGEVEQFTEGGLYYHPEHVSKRA